MIYDLMGAGGVAGWQVGAGVATMAHCIFIFKRHYQSRTYKLDARDGDSRLVEQDSIKTAAKGVSIRSL